MIIPVRTVSENNRREHWAVKAKRTKAQRLAAFVKMREWQWAGEARVNKRIMLIRVAPRELDSDNLAGSLKAVRDGIADALWPELPQKTRDKDVHWEYAQRKGEPKDYHVEVEVMAKEGGR